MASLFILTQLTFCDLHAVNRRRCVLGLYHADHLYSHEMAPSSHCPQTDKVLGIYNPSSAQHTYIPHQGQTVGACLDEFVGSKRFFLSYVVVTLVLPVSNMNDCQEEMTAACSNVGRRRPLGCLGFGSVCSSYSSLQCFSLKLNSGRLKPSINDIPQ